ncbi:hypothetical protein QQS21_006525 [Conoideocrella luteorostrata]|uniref:Zinc transporter n=1 Tax=Conoideocrella luteorostrata TaxID=1105319 RepID=A0AAJ0CME9_9HYPO|nr:hypothetical protein QQS21_006525 [Conoideocrella luteorostrata]
MARTRMTAAVWLLLALVLAVCVLGAPQHVTSANALEALSLEELDQQLQLNAAKHAHHEAAPSSFTTRLFAVLFPGSPAVNALLATLYISGPPNFLLALCPTNIDPSSLSVMVAFAVGGLLGDTLFHLLPEIFLGEDESERARFVLVEPNRNLVLGLAILVGFMTFVAMDKGLRIATGGAGHDHSHGHSHAGVPEDSAKALTTGVDTNGDTKSRKKTKSKKDAVKTEDEERKEINPSVKLGGYLNLM